MEAGNSGLCPPVGVVAVRFGFHYLLDTLAVGQCEGKGEGEGAAALTLLMWCSWFLSAFKKRLSSSVLTSPAQKGHA